MTPTGINYTVCVTRSARNDTDFRLITDSDLAHCHFLSILPHASMVPTLICAMVLLTLLSLVVNGFTLFGIGRSEDLSWEPRYTLLKNLILSDLLQTISIGPAVTHSLVHRHTMSFNGWCLLQYFGGSISIFCSIITITFMALERYLYVCHAISYITILTPLRLRVAVSLTWVISLSFSCINMTLLHMGENTAHGRATVGLMCEPDSVEQQMGFPRPAAIFRKATGTLVLLICLLSYIFAYLWLYHAAHNAVAPFNAVNTRARNTVLFYSGMLFFQLLPVFVKVTSDALWELEGTDAMVTQLDALPSASPSLSFGVLHVFLMGMMMVPPCINPIVYGLRNWEVRQVLPRLFWVKRGRVNSDMAGAYPQHNNGVDSGGGTRARVREEGRRGWVEGEVPLPGTPHYPPL